MMKFALGNSWLSFFYLSNGNSGNSKNNTEDNSGFDFDQVKDFEGLGNNKVSIITDGRKKLVLDGKKELTISSSKKSIVNGQEEKAANSRKEYVADNKKK